MTRFVTADQPYFLFGWAASRLSLSEVWPPESIPRGVAGPGGQLHAVVVYNAFYNDGCHMHIATNKRKHWATRKVLHDLFAFPFIELGLSRVTAEPSVGNVEAQIMALRLGFSVEGRRRGAMNGEDTVVMGMLREECAFIASDGVQLTGQEALSINSQDGASHGQEGRRR